jgi:glyoxylase-like metal-dependent hydrolase (beta-lactamase superfamily II)
LLWHLAELEIAPFDAKYVVKTHLHFDHAGKNDLLKDATFFVQREHPDYAKDNPAFPLTSRGAIPRLSNATASSHSLPVSPRMAAARIYSGLGHAAFVPGDLGVVQRCSVGVQRPREISARGQLAECS